MPGRGSDDHPVVVVDSREQRPYAFKARRVTCVRRALPAGDYSLAGLETVVAVERKTLDDLVNTVIWSRGRFRRELERLRTYEASCVVVEADLRDVLTGKYWSKAHPSSVLGAVMAIIVESGVPVFFCSNRQAARLFVERYLLRCHRRYAGQGPQKNRPQDAPLVLPAQGQQG
ncbi:MAG: hypothetical protein KAY32_12785 [Candidatus Eisenbacteria sp.]|nr:hypothetical protein [Candidatus Eisenbacteria bacterium]